MRSTITRAAVVGAGLLAFSGAAVGAAQAEVKQGENIRGSGEKVECNDKGKEMEASGEIVVTTAGMGTELTLSPLTATAE